MEEFIPTRGSEMKKDAAKQLMVVNYEAPKKKAKKNDGNDVKEDVSSFNEGDKDMDPKRKQELEMKRIRYEVMKFGMSGFEKVKANKAKVQLAISLGAKPHKNVNMNYKTLKEQRKTQKEMQKNEEHTSGLEKSMIKHKTAKTTKMKKKGSSGILDVYGKVSKKPEGKKKR
ncbi:40S small subunit processome assembly factor 1 isoform X2 [Halictus rubicundus]